MNASARVALTVGVLAFGRPAAAGEPPPTRATLCPGEWGCFEQCPLADATPEAPSPLFPRVAIAVSQAPANARRGPTVHFFLRRSPRQAVEAALAAVV